MKKLLFSAALIAVSFTTTAQVGVGTTTPVGSLEVFSSTTNKIGFLRTNAESIADNPANNPVTGPKSDFIGHDISIIRSSDDADFFGASLRAYTFGINTSGLSLNRASGTKTAPVFLNNTAMAGIIAINAINPANVQGTIGAAGLFGSAGSDHSATNGDMTLTLFTTPAGEIVRKNAVKILGNGNVGIGEMNPTNKLVVDGSVRIKSGNILSFQDGLRFLDGGSISSDHLLTNFTTIGRNVNTASLVLTGSNLFNEGGRIKLFGSGAGNNVEVTTPSKFLVNTDVLSVSTTKVGIGTTVPNRKLTVYDATANALVSIIGSATSTPGLVLGTDTADAKGQIRYYNSDDKMKIFTNSYADQLVLLSNRNVGIGTGTPTTRLDVNGYIKVGATDTNGDATPTVGMIRFNAGHFEGCTAVVAGVATWTQLDN